MYKIPNLQTKKIAQKIYHFKTIDSTNLYAEKVAKNNCVGNELIIADTQYSGIGRMNRKWVSPPGGNLYFSIILKSNLKLTPQITILPLLTGLVMVKVLKDHYNIDAQIKWPNDVLINDKKVCGILLKTDTVGDKINFIIIGVGINLNKDPACFDETLTNSAGCVKDFYHKNINKKIFLGQFLNLFERDYDNFISEKEIFLSQIKANIATIGKMIRFEYQHKKLEGVAVDITSNGELLVALNDNSGILLNSTDITYK